MKVLGFENCKENLAEGEACYFTEILYRSGTLLVKKNLPDMKTKGLGRGELSCQLLVVSC